MINATELRIGNCAYYYDGRIIQVDIHVIKALINTPAYCDPIPLTSELLEKIGFTQLENKFTWDFDKLSIHLPSNSYKQGRTYFNSWCIIEHSVKHLHELQNLYFALTQKELPIDNLL